jgi:MFS family permease
MTGSAEPGGAPAAPPASRRAGPAEVRVTFGDVFAVREYRALWSAQVLSLLGDQLAVVALTWLVFVASGSAFLAAATYALSFLPWAIGGPLLSGLADRLPRREVMVGCDLVRAVLMFVMAVPGMPIGVLLALLFVTELVSPLFGAARASLLPDILGTERYVVGTAISTITIQTGQMAGLAAGGLLVAWLQPSAALAINGVSFVLGAVIIRQGVGRRPAARAEKASRAGLVSDAAAGVRLLAGRSDLRALAGFGMIAVFYVIPEGLAVPYAGALGGGSAEAGILLASGPFGAAVGSFVFSRYVGHARRLQVMGSLAVLTCAPLVVCLLRPGFVWSTVLFVVSGLASAYQLAANAAFVAAVPGESRGQAFGLVQALMTVGQGLAIGVAGILAEVWSPSTAVAVAGIAGVVCAAALASAWKHVGPN